MFKAKFYPALILFFVSISNLNAYGQGAWQQYKKLSKPERRWVRHHVFTAKKAMRITHTAMAIYEQVKKDSLLKGPENGGQLDAFRHGIWMALLTKHIGAKRALKLGKAHEQANRIKFNLHQTEEGELPDSVSSVMDLMNNTQGAALAKRNKRASDKWFTELVVAQIKEGKFYIMATNANGLAVDCEGKLIDLNLYAHQWGIPKCITSSNKVF